MKGGHNRAPRALKKLRGTERADRRPKRSAPASPKSVPTPPRGLTVVEKRVWKELAPQVEYIGVYGKSDLTSFRLLVQIVAKTRGKGFDNIAPTAQVRMLQAAASALQNFGLSPASRDRVGGQLCAGDGPDLPPEEKPAEEETPLFGLRVVPKAAAAGGAGG